MHEYQAPIRDMNFVINELLGVCSDWQTIPRFAEIDPADVAQILEEAGSFAASKLAPLNSVADQQGCRLTQGAVTTPDGFADAYRDYCRAGWPSLACDPEHGGQGLPQVLNAALYEMLYATNHAWTMYPGLAHGAYECLKAHAPEDIKAAYIPKIVSGEWLCTMCLTEPQAGSDVGLIRTSAQPQPDGSHLLTGSKIFISGGDHDLTDNIVHLVLARLPDAPVGTRGISLFLVPKYVPTADLKTLNGVQCEGIEKKMGIRGSATCVMRFQDARGWLIGHPHRGLAAMFIMMNSARLYVGLQGLGHAEMACQNAVRYAGERLQMRSVSKPTIDSGRHESGADPIVYHAAIRKTLLTLRATVEGQRALGYWAAHLLDIAEFHPDDTSRAQAHDIASLLTPIIKSFFTENGFVLSSAALQVYGGYGYVHDYGIEQTLRDSRIAMIYEGTNEIQAVDLLVRKVIGDKGRVLEILLDMIRKDAAACLPIPECRPLGEALQTVLMPLTGMANEIIAEAPTMPELSHRIASDFLRLMGLVLLGAMWARCARLAFDRMDDRFYKEKLETAQFYFDYVLPEAHLRLDLLCRRQSPLPWVNVGR